MADIFDLARSINRQREQAKQGYGSPLEDLPLQIAEIMHTREKEKRVSLKNDSALLSNLIKGATTEEEIANVKQLVNKYSIDSSEYDETKLYGDFISQQFNSKQDAYNNFKASAEWLDNKMQATGDSDKTLDPNAPGWIKGYTIAESRIASDEESAYAKEHGLEDKFNREYWEKKYLDDLNKGGASYFKMTSEEMQNLTLDEIEERIREFESISGGFEAGQQFGFKYNKGNSSYVTLQNEYADYKQRLDDTMKAHVTGDKISGEEAMAIMLGDYEGTKRQAITQTNANISQYQKEYNALLTLQRKQLTTDDLSDIYAAYEETKGMSVDAISDYINKKIPVVLNSISNSKERLRLWTGLAPDGGLEDLNKNTQADGDKEELPVGIKRPEELKP